jgi:hypothetical protein
LGNPHGKWYLRAVGESWEFPRRGKEREIPSKIQPNVLGIPKEKEGVGIPKTNRT